MKKLLNGTPENLEFVPRNLKKGQHNFNFKIIITEILHFPREGRDILMEVLIISLLMIKIILFLKLNKKIEIKKFFEILISLKVDRFFEIASVLTF